MAKAREWRFDLTKDLAGALDVVLYEADETGQWFLVDHSIFGPFDTATEVLLWQVRHWAPRAGLPLR